jgi:hypothetical protein
MSPLPPLHEFAEAPSSRVPSPLPIPSIAPFLDKRFDLLKEAGNAANTVGDTVTGAAGKAPEVAQNVGETGKSLHCW